MDNNITIKENHLEYISFSNLERRKLISTGAHGEVWSFQDKVTNEFYAVKILKQTTSELCSTTLTEIENLESIQKSHERPVCFLQYFGYVIIEEKNSTFEEIIDFCCCLVFEMAGANLTDLIKKHIFNKSHISFDTFYKYAKTIIEGMAFLQHRNITHRDIKPENILIKQDENKIWQVKIADFSESRLNIPNSTLENMTIKGTPSYLSPELFFSWKNQKELGHNPYKSDVYSLGLTLLELGTLKKILQGDKRDTMEKDTNPKNTDFGPFDHEINSALDLFFNIYLKEGVNEKKLKDMVKILKQMLFYQERFRHDFMDLLALLAKWNEPNDKRSVNFDSMNIENLNEINEEETKINGSINQKCKEFNLLWLIIKIFEAIHNFEISLKNERIRIIGTANEKIYQNVEGNIRFFILLCFSLKYVFFLLTIFKKNPYNFNKSTILEFIQKLAKINDFEINTKRYFI